MNIGDKILKYRKFKGYSQEDIANSLNVSRQTVSKWETNQSTPDFNKIIPLCKLFEISADELLDECNVETKSDNNIINDDKDDKKRKFAISVCISIFLYFLAVMWIILGEDLGVSDNLNVSVFLGICGVATIILIYNGMVNSKQKEKYEELKEDKKVNKKVKMINDIISMIILIIYLIVSFSTMAWHVTWILWVVYACIAEIVKTIFEMGE